ncbi:ArnT family glycosyltransferase [bacterium]
MLKKNTVFWIFFSAVFAVLILPEITSIGMFFDGVTYAVIARNLAEGTGTFFSPAYITPNFYEHPMLMCFLESIFFRILGDHLIVEKLFSLITCIVTLLLISKIWKAVFRTEAQKHDLNLVWFPLLMFIITPVIYWTFRNNMLENLLIIWGLCAVLLNFRALKVNKNAHLYFILAVICIILGLFTKGPVALFPLAVPFLYWVSYRDKKFSLIIYYSLFQIILLLGLFYLIMQYKPANNFIANYYNGQIAESLRSKGGAVISFFQRFSILKQLFFTNLSIIIGICAVLFIIAKKKRIDLGINLYKRDFLFFFLVGVSSSFPIMISMEQSSFYLVPSLPYYIIAFSIIVLGAVKYLYNSINEHSSYYKIFKKISIALLMAGLLYPLFVIGKIKRDHYILDDIYILKPYMPNNIYLGVSQSLTDNWGLHAYMYRIFYNKLDDQTKDIKYYFLIKDDMPLNKNAVKVNAPTKNFDLYIAETKGE